MVDVRGPRRFCDSCLVAVFFALQFFCVAVFFLRCSFCCVGLVSWAFWRKGWDGLMQVGVRRWLMFEDRWAEVCDSCRIAFFLHCMFGLVFLLALQFFALQCFLCSCFFALLFVCLAFFFALQFLLRSPGFLGFLGEELGW